MIDEDNTQDMTLDQVRDRMMDCRPDECAFWEAEYQRHKDSVARVQRMVENMDKTRG